MLAPAMAYSTRLSTEADNFLQALQPVCDLIEEHALAETSGRASLANLLKRHREMSERTDFFVLGSRDFSCHHSRAKDDSARLRHSRRRRTTSGACHTVLGGPDDVVLQVLNSADRHA